MRWSAIFCEWTGRLAGTRHTTLPTAPGGGADYQLTSRYYDQGNSPSSAGMVRPMAELDPCRWVSAPRVLSSLAIYVEFNWHHPLMGEGFVVSSTEGLGWG